MPHLVACDDHRSPRRGRVGKAPRRIANPIEYRYVTEAEDAGDPAKAHVAHAVQHQGQRLHLRGLALRRRHGEVAAARPAAVALQPPHNPVPHIVRRLATLANDLVHGSRLPAANWAPSLYPIDPDVYLL